MPIPHFADHGALPHFILSDATNPSCRSPYRATMLELVQHFCTSRTRANLLSGLNQYRKHLFDGGFSNGFQWIDGSFVENVEETQRRAPRDIDVVTLYNRPAKYQDDSSSWASDYTNHLRREYFDTFAMKPRFNCDTYDIDLDAGGRPLVRNTTYWFGLFSETRNGSTRKGIVELALPKSSREFSAVELKIAELSND